jgi:hypothetical protein
MSKNIVYEFPKLHFILLNHASLVYLAAYNLTIYFQR